MSKEKFDTGPWLRLEAINHAGDSEYGDPGVPIANINAGDYVADLRFVERFAFKLTDDIDIRDQASGPMPVRVDSDGDVAIQMPGEMRIDHITADGNVRLEAGGSIVDLDTNSESESSTAPVITTTGNLLLQSNAGAIGVGGADGNSPLRVSLSGGTSTSQLSADVATNIYLEQVGAGADLIVSRVNATAGFIDIRVLDGSMEVGRLQAGTGIYLEAYVDIVDAFDDAAVPVVNLTTTQSSPTGDVVLWARTGNIGAQGNFLDVDIGLADLIVAAGGDIFINSVGDLNIRSVNHKIVGVNIVVPIDVFPGRNVTFDVDGDVYVDFVAATGTVRIEADRSIIDRRNAVHGEGGIGPNIDSDKAILIAGRVHEADIGTPANYFETRVRFLEMWSMRGGIWLDNTGDVVIGGVDAGQVGVMARDEIFIRAHSNMTVDEDIDSDGDDVVLAATESVIVNATIVTGGGNVDIDALLDVVVNGTITSGTGIIDIDAVRDITLSETGLITTTSGWVDLDAGRDIWIHGDIDSTTGAVNLRADRNITFGSTGSIITDATVTLTADVDADGYGHVLMTDGSYVDATHGLIDVDAWGDVTVSLLRTHGEVAIDTRAGAILDADTDAGQDVVATQALLHAAAGIGTDANPLETALVKLEVGHVVLDAFAPVVGGIYVDDKDETGYDEGGLVIGTIDTVLDSISTLAAASTVGLLATGTIRVTTTGFMTVREWVKSTLADVMLQAIDTSTVTVDPNMAPVGDEFPDGDGGQFAVVTDTTDVDEDFILRDGARIEGATTVTLRAGDDLLIDAGTSVVAGTTLTLRGDHGNADLDTGTHINILGSLSSATTEITGERDGDIIYLHPESLVGQTTVLGDDDGAAGGDDILIVDRLPTTASLVRLDGRGGTDLYVVNNTGNADYVINVFDSGAPDDGIDALTINATSDDDVFLLRKTLSLSPSGYAIGFVAKLDGDYTPGVGFAKTSDQVERVNYDASINARLRINAFAGDDSFFVDDNAATTTIDGGVGDDYFQVGQVFRSERDARAGVAPGDEFATLETTRGFLSNGASSPLTLYGSDGDDEFQVYHNSAVLRLEGGNHDDTFVVRAFVVLDDFAKQAMTEINSGEGADHIQYAINAPVSIDGGDGFDSVVIVGTEFADSFVITPEGVFGAGLSVTFKNTESLQIDGLEGDDHFFILGTSDKMSTEIIGSLGSDTFEVSGDVTRRIVSNDLQGLSGIISHVATSDDPAYNGIPVDDIVLRAGQSDVPQVIVRHSSDGFTQVDEGGKTDTYSIRLASAPTADVYLTVSAPLSALGATKEETGEGVTVSAGGAPARALVLKFTPGNWNVTQTITVAAIDDAVKEEHGDIEISHTVISADPKYNGIPIVNLLVNVRDDDAGGLFIDETGGHTKAVEGGATDTYDVRLTHQPTADVKVTLSPDLGSEGQVLLTYGDGTELPTDGDGKPYLNFNLANWNVAQTIRVTAVSDGLAENKHSARILHTLSSLDPDFDRRLENDDLQTPVPLVFELNVALSDEAGVEITESDASTFVIAGAADGSQIDTYDVRLTSEPTADVTITILSDGLSNVAPVSLTFTPTGGATPWNVPQTVTVTAVPSPNVAENELHFAPAAQRANVIQGPLTIWGGNKPDTIRSLAVPVTLPTETNAYNANGAVTAATADTLTVDVVDGGMSLADIMKDVEEFHGITYVGILDESGEIVEQRLIAAVDDGAGTLLLAEPLETVPASGTNYLILFRSRTFDAVEADQIDTLNVFNTLSPSNDVGILTGTTLTGLGMRSSVQIGTQTLDGGITYADLEVLEIFLGKGNDTFTVEGTAAPRADGTITSTILHGGGNSLLEVSGTLDFATPTPGELSIMRPNALDWDAAFFDALDVPANKVRLTVNELLIGDFAVLSVVGDTLILDVTGLISTPDGSYANTRVTVIDGDGGAVLGGDHITVLGGGGALSPLVIYGDTSSDLGRYVSTRGGETPSETVKAAFTVVTGETHVVVPNDTLFDWAAHDFRVGQIVRLEAASGDFEDFEVRRIEQGLAGESILVLVGATTLTGPEVAVSFVGATQEADSVVGDKLTDLGADFSNILLGANPHVGILEQLRVVSGTLTGATTEKLITRTSASWIATVETGADLRGVAEVVYGLGKDAFVGLLDGNDKVVSSRRIIDVDVANGRIRVAGGWDIDPDAGAAFTVFYHGEMIESRAISAVSPDGNTLTLDVAWSEVQPVGTAYVVYYPWWTDGGDFLGTPGHDVIDASASSMGVVIFGGAGDDFIRGSLGNDQIAGGAGDDTIYGEAGDDHIYGDSGFNTDFVPHLDGGSLITLSSQILTVVTTTGTPVPTETEGADSLFGGSGDDIIFGDHGVIQQSTAPLGEFADVGTTIPQTLAVQRLVTTGGAWLERVETVNVSAGEGDVIAGNEGNDIVLGGIGGDKIHAGEGNNLVIGDHGFVVFGRAYAGAPGSEILNVPVDRSSAATVYSYGYSYDTDLADIDWIESTVWSVGGADEITTGTGADIVLGGAGADLIHAGSGDNLVLGDSGQIVAAQSNDSRFGDGAFFGPSVITLGRVMSTAPVIGGNDRITTLGGNDIVIAGMSGNSSLTLWDTPDVYRDVVDAGNGNNLVLGDSGLLVFAQAMDDATSTRTVTVTVDPTRPVDQTVPATSEYSYTYTSDANPSYNVEGAEDDIDYITTTAPTIGGPDTIRTGGGNDFVFGGTAGDRIATGAGNDLVFGDHGELKVTANTADPGIDADLLPLSTYAPQFTFTSIDTENFDDDDPGQIARVGGDDWISSGVDVLSQGESDQDIVIGGQGRDVIYGGADDDDLIGGHNVATVLDADGAIDEAAHDEGDFIDGGSGDDVIAGDNASIERRGDTLSPRMQVLSGTAIYGETIGLNDGEALVADDEQLTPTGVYGAGRVTRSIVLFDHSDAFASDSAKLATHGADYIAGGADDDEIFGQLGDDVIQGDGSLGGALGIGTLSEPDHGYASGDVYNDGRTVLVLDDDTIQLITLVGANRDTDGTLDVSVSVELSSDGDDYIEGNGGEDVIFGNLGQDDIVGGSSTLFGLSGDESLRPDGSDTIFGGAGIDLARNDAGDETDSGHARDADVIAGDNANIYRLVGTNGATSGGFLTFNYDNYAVALRIIPRAVELVDYTEGGPDFDTGAADDNGAADELHGESGDDQIYGMVGNDVLFGEGQDDDLIGGWGHDWISGGTGEDGILGDDGRIHTSRNSSAYGEPLYGIAPLLASDPNARFNDGNVLNEEIATPGDVQWAIINVADKLKKTANLTPFNVDSAEDPLFDAEYADDIIYGGWGDDSLHGGSGDDAMSGAEALPDFYAKPVNSGFVLGYDPSSGEFAAYDEYNPRTRIEGFLLNFDHLEGPSPVRNGTADMSANTDGNDAIFGDLGNDWLVGGTGRDHLWGGWGDDLLNADDKLGTDGGSNNSPDTHWSYEDLTFGGAGRDRLIGNTGGDRLIDWAGEFNSYIVPFAPFGNFTISRSIQPQLPEFLYALSESDGVDTVPYAGADIARNGEPEGELGLVKQQDFAWRDQTGAPDDVQPGNIPGGSRDVLRAATFNDGTMSNFAPDSGKWSVQNGALRVSAQSLGGDAVAVFHVGDALPGYFEIQASISADKPTSGWKANSYVIFDYQGEYDFKFAGLDVSLNKLVMGHRDASGWIVDKQAAFAGSIKSGTTYNVLVAINGVNATLVVNNKNVFSYSYAPRVVDGYSFGLNTGLVGVGSDNARGTFDNVKVQVLPPQITFQSLENFADGKADLFVGDSIGTWTVSRGRYGVTPASGETAASLMDLGVGGLSVSSVLDLSATVNTLGRAGFVFDRYDAETFKFVAIDAVADQVIIGHHTAKSGWVSDTMYAKPVDAGRDYTLGVSLKGSTVSVTLNGNVVLGYAFNASTVDGHFGLLATGGAASFDDVIVKTNDPAFETGGATLLAAQSPGTAETYARLSQAQLQSIAKAAVDRLGPTLDAAQREALNSVTFQVIDLPWLELGNYRDGVVWIDADAAGYGWFIDVTPWSDREFAEQDGTPLAVARIAEGRMDLLTVVAHELGHAAGLEHEATGLMTGELQAGVRLLPVAPFDELDESGSFDPRHAAAPVSDFAVQLLSPAPEGVSYVGWQTWTGAEGPRRVANDSVPLAFATRAERNAAKSSALPGATDWRLDFVNHLGRSETERNPNAKLRVLAATTAKVTPEISSRVEQ